MAFSMLFMVGKISTIDIFNSALLNVGGYFFHKKSVFSWENQGFSKKICVCELGLVEKFEFCIKWTGWKN